MEATSEDRWGVWAAFTFGYLLLCLQPVFDILAQQRSLTTWVREWLKRTLNLQRIRIRPVEEEDAIDEDQPAPGWRLPPLAYASVLFCQTFSNLYEGRWIYASSTLGIFLVAGFVALFASPRGLRIFSHVNFIHHVSSLLFLPTVVDNRLIARATISRALACISLTDRMDEALLQMIIFSMTFIVHRGYDDGVVFLPLKMWLMVVLPVQLIGLRDWMSSSKILNEKNLPAKGTLRITAGFFSALFIPLALILFPFYDRNPGLKLVRTGIGFHVLSIIVFSFKASAIDNYLMKSTLIEDKRRGGEGGLLGEEERIMLALTRRITFVCTGLAWIFSLFGMLYSRFYVVSTCTIILGVGGLVSNNRKPWLPGLTSSDLASFCQMVPLMLLGVWGRDAANGGSGSFGSVMESLVALSISSSRALTCFQKQRFSSLQVQSSVIAVAAIAAMSYVGNDDMTRFVSMTSLIVYGMNILVACIRELCWDLIRRESDAYSFFSHALKQKYCAVGSAIDHIVELVRCSPPKSRASSPGCQYRPSFDYQDLPLLRGSLAHEIIKETRRGQTVCHAHSLMRNIMYQMYHESAVAKRVFAAELEAWIEKGLISRDRIELVDLDETLDLSINWDVFKAFVIHFGVRVARLRFEYHRGKRSLSVTVASFRGLTDGDKSLIAAVAKVLDAACFENSEGFKFQASDAEDDAVKRASTSQVGSHSSTRIDGLEERQDAASPQLPPGLIFAVLDDTKLIRVNMKRVLEQYAKADPRSIYVGATEHECLDFAQQVMKLQPDIVLLDEHLVNDISGTYIGKIIRSLGFSKLLLLHSASTASRMSKLDECFDGLVQKTSSKHELLQNIAKYYYEAKRKGSVPPSPLSSQELMSRYSEGEGYSVSSRSTASTLPSCAGDCRHNPSLAGE